MDMVHFLAQPKEETTNLKTKNNHNCQKIELYGSLTTEEFKKKHLSRLLGGVDTGTLSREDIRQGVADEMGSLTLA